jgi:hypothetical protein
MSLENLCFNLSTGRFVRSATSPTPTDWPVFGYGDARDFAVTFVSATSDTRVQVETAVTSAKITLSNPLTLAEWTSADASAATASSAFPFLLPVTSSNLSTFMSGKITNQMAYCEFLLGTASGSNRYGSTIYIKPQLNTGVTSVAVVSDVALGKNEAQGIYVSKAPAKGTRILFTDEITDQLYSVGFANGQFLAELL